MQTSRHGIQRWWVQILIWAVVFTVGLWVGYRLDRVHLSKAAGTGSPWRSHLTQYPLISPLLACKSSDQSLYLAYPDLVAKVTEVISQARRKSAITEAGVYFRDLQSSQWAGINEDVKFYPASLLKVPIMIALFKVAETDPGILDRKLVYQQTSPVNESPFNSSTSTHLQAGQSYSVSQLIEAMIVDSDNNAKDLLGTVVDTKIMVDLFNALEIPIPYKGFADETYGISPRQYSLVFRVLHNSTFLNEEMSERALELLARSTFSQGLRVGVPEKVKISHKFGIFTVPNTGEELHDCGIVYDEKHPYLLCVMTRGRQDADMAATIGQISSTVFNYVSSLAT